MKFKYPTIHVVWSNIQKLNECPKDKWAELFVQLKLEFFRDYQLGCVFSTQFGADFFEECYNWIRRNDFLPPNGEYDKVFNAWLKVVRTEK